MNPSKQTIADVAMIARNAIDRVIELEGNKRNVQREWVGLTDEEISASSKGHMTRNGFARAIEAKLKEKNT